MEKWKKTIMALSAFHLRCLDKSFCSPSSLAIATDSPMDHSASASILPGRCTCSKKLQIEGGSCRKHHALEHAAHREHRAMSVRHPLSVEVLKEECKIFLFASHRCAEALKDSSAGISSLAHSCQSRLLFPPARFNLAKCSWYSVGV